MRKILFVCFLLYTPFAFAIQQQAKKAQENTNFILSFFSPDFFLNLLFVIVVIVVFLFLSKIINSKISSYIEQREGGEGREELVGVLTRTSDITLLIIGTSIILGILGVDTGIFMGGLGFGLGFTLKIFLSNFIAGVVMVTQGYYHNGDLVEIEGKIGYIKKINALFTEIEQFDGIIFYVPNIKFLENNVKNYYSNSRRRVEINVGVDYSTDLVKAKKVIFQVLNSFSNILQAPEPEVLISKFDSSSINLSVRFWIDSKGKYFETKSNVTETINLAFKKAGIKIPFPQVTLSSRGDFKVSVKNF